MNMAERPTGREVCSSPEELAGLFNQWKLSPEGLMAERKIAYAVYKAPNATFDLIEPLRDFTFGIYLARQTFPFVEKYPYPALKIDQRRGLTAAASTRYILAGEAWLQEHSSVNHPSTYLITTGVEEYSHWVLRQAIQYRSEDYRTSLDSHYRLTKEGLKRAEEETSAKAAKVEDTLAKIEAASAHLEEMESLNPVKYAWLVFSGKIGQQIEDAEKQMTEARKRLAEVEKWKDFHLSALLEHASTIDEGMGIVWRNLVSQRYYPWSEEARRAQEQLENVLSYKRQKSHSLQGSTLKVS